MELHLLQILQITFLFTDNTHHGLLVERLPFTDFTGSKFCDVTCIRCEHTVDDFPLRFTMDKAYRASTFECSKVTREVFIENIVVVDMFKQYTTIF